MLFSSSFTSSFLPVSSSLFIVLTIDHPSLYLLPFPFSFHRFPYLHFLYPHSNRTFLKYVNLLFLKYSLIWNLIHCHLSHLLYVFRVVYLGHNYHIQRFITLCCCFLCSSFCLPASLRCVAIYAFIRGSCRPVYPASKYYPPILVQMLSDNVQTMRWCPTMLELPVLSLTKRHTFQQNC
jgi:hypothetical protein